MTTQPRKPPPLPKRAGTPLTAPLPTSDGRMTTGAKLSLADIALALRDEQIEARIAHYRPELTTSPELDAITAQIVAEFQALRAARPQASVGEVDRFELEVLLIDTLKQMLGRIFRTDRVSVVMQRQLQAVSKRFARLFFQSELGERVVHASEAKKIRFAEQGLFQVLALKQSDIETELDKLDWDAESLCASAKEELADFIQQTRTAYLGRTTPELNRLVTYLNEVLTAFFCKELPGGIGELSWEVIKSARLAARATNMTAQIAGEQFGAFREAFERRFLERLVPFVEDEMLKRVRDGSFSFRLETLHFVADPHIFSDVCELVCDAVYDHLATDGFLDLPVNWRAKSA